MHNTQQRFERAFSSYGATPWLPDLDAWAQGVYNVLNPGGRLVYVDFHPLVWCWDKELRPTADDYFKKGPFTDPVGDYVAASGPGLGAITTATTQDNKIPAHSYQHGFGEILEALARAGFLFERVREYPHSNGCKVTASLVPGKDRRWEWPAGIARTPLMFGIAARRPER
jgi:hypothetical protein